MTKDKLSTGDQYLECGKIINTHGVKGDVKIDSWCDSPDILASLGNIYFKNESGYEKKTRSQSLCSQKIRYC
jgi:ribosomal 30S subunit maturation factor RimM